MVSFCSDLADTRHLCKVSTLDEDKVSHWNSLFAPEFGAPWEFIGLTSLPHRSSQLPSCHVDRRKGRSASQILWLSILFGRGFPGACDFSISWCRTGRTIRIIGTILQQGLIRILEHASAQSVSEQEILDLKLKTQLFYFNRCVLITVNLIWHRASLRRCHFMFMSSHVFVKMALPLFHMASQ